MGISDAGKTEIEGQKRKLLSLPLDAFEMHVGLWGGEGNCLGMKMVRA